MRWPHLILQLIGVVGGITLLACSPLYAAKIEVLEIDPNSVPLIMVTGDFVYGDARSFESRTQHLRRGLVFLSSPGGVIRDALDIGAQIRNRGFSTSVTDECVSACGLVWLSGTRRYLNNGSRLGFHAAYTKSGNQTNESGVANAEIGSFLTHLGYSLPVIQFVTLAPPNEVRWLTRIDAARLGIQIQPAPPVDVSGSAPQYMKETNVDPNQRKLVSIAIYASHLIVTSHCRQFFKVDYDFAMAEHKRAMLEGQNLNDPRFSNYLGDELTARADEIKRDGVSRFCQNEKQIFDTPIGRRIYIP